MRSRPSASSGGCPRWSTRCRTRKGSKESTGRIGPRLASTAPRGMSPVPGRGDGRSPIPKRASPRNQAHDCSDKDGDFEITHGRITDGAGGRPMKARNSSCGAGGREFPVGPLFWGPHFHPHPHPLNHPPNRLHSLHFSPTVRFGSEEEDEDESRQTHRSPGSPLKKASPSPAGIWIQR